MTPKVINFVTARVCDELTAAEQEELIRQFTQQASEHDDWLYELRLGERTFFAQDHGEGGYPLMFAEEY